MRERPYRGATVVAAPTRSVGARETPEKAERGNQKDPENKRHEKEQQPWKHW